MGLRNYSNTTPNVTLRHAIDAAAVYITCTNSTDVFPAVPFTLILEPDTVNEEVVEVTSKNGTENIFTITRGVDGTTAKSHSAGASAIHGVSARDFAEANEFINSSGGGGAAIAFNATAGSDHLVTRDLEAGLYTVTCPVSTIATVLFYASDGSLVTTAATVSGIVNVTLSTPCVRFVTSVDTGSDVPISLELTATLVSAPAATLETLATSGTYTPSVDGFARVLAIGGGGGGSNHSGNNIGYGQFGGGGGGSGYATLSTIDLIGSSGISVTVGAGASTNGTGGTTTFGSISAAGGRGGANGNGNAPGHGGAGGNGGSGGGGGCGQNNSVDPQDNHGTNGGDGRPGSTFGNTPKPGAGGTGSGVTIDSFTTPGSTSGSLYAGGQGGSSAAGGASGVPGSGGGGGFPSSGRTGGDGAVFLIRWDS